ncbi:MAG: type I-U CRISPR-associated protein Csx17 [Streptosporangiaceae bacterium]
MSQSTVPRHVLPGVWPEPIASYLAGLGLIRVLGEQADAGATAAWTDDGLVITTAVDDIAAWLADQYTPTPVLSPWNNGSGFGPKDKEPKRTLQALETHPSPRLMPLQSAIPVARQVSIRAQAEGWLTDAAKGGDKARVVQEFRNRCPEGLLAWIDATVVLAGDDLFFPPLLGSGGNDGRLDFSTNFHRRLLEVLDVTERGKVRALGCARDLLAGTQTQPLADAAIGQFDPAAAGGPGSSVFGAADHRVNPWAYVLLVEGALLFAAGAARRFRHEVGRAAIPFTALSSSPHGSASGAEGEESRGEIWVPVWRRAFTLAEIRQLFGEARATWRSRPARRSAEFYAATRTLGVARGVDEFVRYGLHRRNGLAFAAVPVDRIDVHTDRNVGLIAAVEDWAARLRRSDTPAALGQALRQFDKAELEYARDGEALALARMLAALTTLEQAVGRSAHVRDKAQVRRPPGASPFLEVFATQTCAELRLAAGVASCATLTKADRAESPPRTMRQVLLPIDPPGVAERFRSPGRWRDAPLVPGFGIRPVWEVLAAVMAWRSRTATDEPGQHRFRGVLTFRKGIPVPVADLHAFARGQLNWDTLDFWLRACLALDWRGVQRQWPADSDPLLPVPILGLLHPLAAGLAPNSGKGEGDAPRLALRPDWASRLIAGQISSVHKEAAARLRQAGWEASPPLPGAEPQIPGVHLAAALLPRCRGSRRVMRMLTIELRDLDQHTRSEPPHPVMVKEPS